MRQVLPLLVVPFVVATSSSLLGCREPEVRSLLGRPLAPVTLDPEVRRDREQELTEAEEAYREDPTDVVNVIWLGRRWAYLGEYRRAIAIYTEGLRLAPAEPRLLRHRGHRFITVRQLDDAIADLERAATLIDGRPDEVEEDGLPNRLNIPTSTSHTNIYYHLGLARYLLGDFDGASTAYATCLGFSKNDDMRCAASYWLYLSLRRAGRDEEADAILIPITPDMIVIENESYHRLLLLYKGVLTPDELLGRDAAGRAASEGAASDHGASVGAVPEGAPLFGETSAAAIDDATLAYGLGAWHLLRGDDTGALAIFEQITNGPAWPAFGHIAAEAELVNR